MRSKQSNLSQFIDYEELQTILAIEAKRPIVEAKRNLKLVDYSLASQWLNEVGISINPFEDCDDVKQLIRQQI